jgi:hypothetical protein
VYGEVCWVWCGVVVVVVGVGGEWGKEEEKEGGKRQGGKGH